MEDVKVMHNDVTRGTQFESSTDAPRSGKTSRSDIWNLRNDLITLPRQLMSRFNESTRQQDPQNGPYIFLGDLASKNSWRFSCCAPLDTASEHRNLFAECTHGL